MSSANTFEEPTREHVADGVVVRQEIDNMGWADMGGYTLVVDALEKAGCRDAVFRAIRETMPCPAVKTVLNTHTHYDHVALNPAFESEFGAEIINRDTREIPDDGLSLAGDRRSCRVIPMPRCHTATDCVVWFPTDRVLFVGDLFGWGLIPYEANLRPEGQQRVEDVYERLIAFDADTVVPGHGPLCSTAELKRFTVYFRDLRRAALECVQAGLSEGSAAQKLAPPADMRHWWRFESWKHANSVQKVMKAARQGWLGGSARK